MKDAKGHGSNGRLARGTSASHAGRDALGRTYTQALRDHDRFPNQNPHAPNPDLYRTPVPSSSNAEAAAALMSTLRSTQAPIHPAMQYGRDLSAPTGLDNGFRSDTVRTKQGAPGRGIDYKG